MPWQNQGGGGGGPGAAAVAAAAMRPRLGRRGRGPQPPNFEEMLRRGQDRFRRAAARRLRQRRAASRSSCVGDRRAVAGERLLPRAARRGGRRAALRRLSTARRQPGPQLSPADADRERADAERDARQSHRDRLSRRAEQRPQRRRRAELPRRSADADRRREHRRHQLHRVLGDQGRAGLSVQHPRSRGHGEIGGRERDARGCRPDRDRAARSPKAAARSRPTRRRCCRSILDCYGAGIEITQVQLQKVDPPAPVIDAFRDVQRAARPASGCATRPRPIATTSCRGRAATRRASSRRPRPIAQQIVARGAGRCRPLPVGLSSLQGGRRT